jgi:hypothetical protein
MDRHPREADAARVAWPPVEEHPGDRSDTVDRCGSPVMRLVDLLRPYLAEATHVEDCTPSSLHIGRQIFLPGNVDIARTIRSAGSHPVLGPGTIALTVVGPDPDLHGDPDILAQTLDRLRVGGRVVILFGWQAAVLPYRRVLDQLAEHHCQVLQAAELDADETPSAVVVERVDRLVPFHDALGQTADVAPGDDAARLRLLVRLVDTALFAELTTRAMQTTRASEPMPPNPALAMELERQDARIRQLEAKIASYEASTSLRAGRAIVRLTRPLRRLVAMADPGSRGGVPRS